MKEKEISLSELLSTNFIIVDDKMVGTFPLDRINMISDVLKQQKEEIDNLQDRIDKAIEYITSEESIDIFTTIESREQWLKVNKKLLNILRGEK